MTPNQLQTLRKAGQINRAAIEFGFDLVKTNRHINELELDNAIGDFIRGAGGEPAFYQYQEGNRIFPRNTCISPNNRIVHGVARQQNIYYKILTIDCGVKIKCDDGSWIYVDAADTKVWSTTDYKRYALLAHSKYCLEAGMSVLKPGVSLWEITNAINTAANEKFATRLDNKFKIFPQWCGHGIGLALHQAPSFVNTFEGLNDVAINQMKSHRLQEGDTFCLEPITTIGSTRHIRDIDGWTEKTAHNNFTCHLEHTLRITHNGYEIIC